MSSATPESDADRHRAMIGEIEEAGVTHMIIGVASRAPEQTLEFIEGFGATYLSGSRVGA